MGSKSVSNRVSRASYGGTAPVRLQLPAAHVEVDERAEAAGRCTG
jgi:hypothetical protein